MLARWIGLMAMRTSVMTRSCPGAAEFLYLGLVGGGLVDLEMRGPVEPPVLKCDNVDCRNGAASFFSGGERAIVASQAVWQGTHAVR